MEQKIIRDWSEKNNFIITASIENLLILFAEMIHSSSSRFNLTGFKSKEKILADLVLGSIEPFIEMNVPRGTLFADIGTGPGIPGIPIALVFDNLQGILIDSNQKKTAFLEKAIEELKLRNVQALNARVEDLARNEYRERFDMVFSRAMGNHFLVVELAAPLLKHNGSLFIYSGKKKNDISPYIRKHAGECGLVIMDGCQDQIKVKDGIYFIKNNATVQKYPRSIAVIKRDIKRLS